MDCTTVAFQGMITVIDPSASWAAKWLHVCEWPADPAPALPQTVHGRPAYSQPALLWLLHDLSLHGVCQTAPVHRGHQQNLGPVNASQMLLLLAAE